jgi:hypothetical protein
MLGIPACTRLLRSAKIQNKYGSFSAVNSGIGIGIGQWVKAYCHCLWVKRRNRNLKLVFSDVEHLKMQMSFYVQSFFLCNFFPYTYFAAFTHINSCSRCMRRGRMGGIPPFYPSFRHPALVLHGPAMPAILQPATDVALHNM